MRKITPITCLALFPLAGFLTVAHAQHEEVGAVQCDAQVDLEYLQYATIARVEGTVVNETCAASSGDYSINIRIRDQDGSLETVRFSESWQRDDDRPVAFIEDYPIGDNVYLINVRALDVSCACAEPMVVSAEAPVAEPVDVAPEPMSRRELRQRLRAAAAVTSAPIVEEEQECRSQRVTGSRLPRRICMTSEEWEMLEALEESAAAEMLRRSRESTIEPSAFQGAAGALPQ